MDTEATLCVAAADTEATLCVASAHSTATALLSAGTAAAAKFGGPSIQLLDRALNAVSGGIVIFDAEPPDNRVIYCNSAAERITGYSRADLVARGYEILNDSEAATDIQRATLSGCEQRSLVRNRTRSGSAAWYEATVTAIRAEDGRLTHYLCALNDVTELKSVERTLKRSNRRLTNVLESIDEAFMSLDRHWNVSLLNAKAERLLRRKRDRIVNSVLWELFPTLADSEVGCNLRRAMEKQRLVEFEHLCPDCDSWLVIRAYPSQDGVSVYARNVTAQKQVEESMQRSVDQMRASLDGIVNAMALTVEVRDPYTADHQRRVSVLASAIARELGLSAKQVDAIRIAGLLHDVGKITVPTEILNKPSRLSRAEHSIIQTHPRVGYDILQGIDFAEPVALVALQHHERLDGSGYPAGLIGDEAILEARIMAVADVVEAMASHRPYRPALGIEKALEEILKNQGVRYDIESVDACLRVFTKNGFDFELLVATDRQPAPAASKPS